MTQRRTHIVLVPGFAGFDALGQIEYYAGTTARFQRSCREAPLAAATQRASATLCYFDNVPSASVAERAQRLRAFLAKLVARNQIQPHDAVALVGHSTGGLDIRRMVHDLEAAQSELLVDDGSEAKPDDTADPPITNGRLLAMIERVVFLSTPHAGANIADFIDRHAWLSRAGLRLTKLGMRLTRGFPARLSQRALDLLEAGLVRAGWDLDPLLALLDAYREGDEDAFPKTSSEAASARQAYAQFELWIDHMIANFQVIKDLKTADHESTRSGPNTAWPAHIETRSYATFGRDPRNTAGPDTDALYRVIYELGRDGRFRARVRPTDLRWFDRELPPQQLDDSTNAGIVNTLSMFFEGGGETYLVSADHGDVIGHYRRARAETPAGRPRQRFGFRRYRSYDFFRSCSGFGDQAFARLWTDIFDFCVGGAVQHVGAADRAPRVAGQSR